MSQSATESSDNKNNNFCDGILKMACFLCMLGAVVFLLSTFKSYEGPKFSINDAYLTRFNYTETNHTLSYKLTLNIALTNPNKGLPFDLIDMRVAAYYQNKRFGLVSLDDDRRTTFHQDPKNTSIFQNVVVQGWKEYMVLEEPVLANAAHLYSVDVVIAFQEKVGKMSGQVMCNLNVPLRFNGTSWGDDYKPTKCSQDSLTYDCHLEPPKVLETLIC